jgi:uncharacterized membrane protein YedE/YeeE
MSARAAAAVIGIVFGVVLSWSGMSNPDVLRSGLLFESSYLVLFFGAAVTTAFAGLALLRRARTRALITREPIAWAPVAPERRHVVGSVLFGIGWGVANVCPGPIAAQLGQGVAWSVCTTVVPPAAAPRTRAASRRPAPRASRSTTLHRDNGRRRGR